jgi:hypothetical protein
VLAPIPQWPAGRIVRTMPSLPETLFEAARRRVDEGRARIVRHQAYIARLREQGDSTRQAEVLLDSFERSQRLFEEELVAIQKRQPSSTE